MRQILKIEADGGALAYPRTEGYVETIYYAVRPTLPWLRILRLLAV